MRSDEAEVIGSLDDDEEELSNSRTAVVTRKLYAHKWPSHDKALAQVTSPSPDRRSVLPAPSRLIDVRMIGRFGIAP